MDVNKQNRRQFIKVIGSGLAAMTIPEMITSCGTSKKRPNILFIMSDDHTAQAWGIYGGILKDYVKNEHIKRLAAEGCVLDNCFCTNSICVPSRASIMTGQFSHKNGVYTLSDALDPEAMNVAKLLQGNGYQTALVGKWHLKKQPSGFDYFSVLPGQGRYHNPILKTAENWEDGWKGGAEVEGFSSDVIADQTIDWLEQRDPSQPFMAMCHFKATHEPFDYPERFKDLYKDVDLPEPESLFDFGPETTGRTFTGQKLEIMAGRWEQATKDPDNFWTSYPGLPYPLEGLEKEEKRKKIYQKFVKDFLRCGAAIDDNIGKLLNYIDKEGLTDDTVVIYTADQGYFLGEYGFFDKRLIYEESLRMPFVIRYPREIPAGSRTDDIIMNVDFPSLFADYAKVAALATMQGRSFRENVKGNTPADWRTAAYYRYWTHENKRPAHFGIRNDRYKLAFFYGHPLDRNGNRKEAKEPAWEFYDLKTDPREVRNAYNDPEYADIITEMKKELLHQREKYGDTDADSPDMQTILKNHWD